MLLDQDREARAVAADLERSLAVALRVDCVRTSVRTMQQDRSLQSGTATFDAIYSMGLFDYLTDKTATAILAWMYERLSPAGEMTIGNFTRATLRACSWSIGRTWTLCYRSEGELLQLADPLEGARARVSSEESGCQAFLHVTRERRVRPRVFHLASQPHRKRSTAFRVSGWGSRVRCRESARSRSDFATCTRGPSR